MNGTTSHREINGYQLLELIGSGGMSKVWRGERVKDGKEVAVKVIPIEDLAPDFERRLRREPEIHQKMQHENIVALLDWFREGDEFFLVMEYVAGLPLSKLIKDSGPLPFSRVREIMRDVLRALHHLHANDIVHRDIKPGNILVGADGGAKLTDFGIAKFAWQQGETRTQKGLGTPEYMSPEQVRGSAIDYRTDIWSIGVTLFEMLTARKPFSRTEETPAHYAEVIGKILNQDIPDPRQFVSKVPDGVISIIKKATARNSVERFSSAAEILGALEVVDETKWTPLVDPDATVVLGGASQAPPTEIRPVAPPVIRPAEVPQEEKTGKAGLIVTLVLLVLSVGGYFGYQWYEQNQQNAQPLTKERAIEVSKELAADYKRFSYDGNVPALTTLYATEGVSFFRLRNVGREAIDGDYQKFFEKIVRTDRLEVEVNKVDVADDSTFTTQWIITYERLKDDGTILKGEAIHDLTIRRYDDDWLIIREKQRAIRRNDVKPPPVDTTKVDTAATEENPDEPVEETPALPSSSDMRSAVEGMLVLINSEKSGQAWSQYASEELKGKSGGFPAALAEGSVSLRKFSVNGATATVTLAKSDGFAQKEMIARFTFAPGNELKLADFSLSE
ncbi:MAG: serine/threonine protein kinase [Candidatus Kapaibacterium sp.]